MCFTKGFVLNDWLEEKIAFDIILKQLTRLFIKLNTTFLNRPKIDINLTD